MSRAIRRHPLSTKPSKKPAPIKPTRPAKGPSAPRAGKGLRARLTPRWIEDIISELRKVTWPSRQETANLTMVVLVVAIAIGFLLGGIDMLFNWIVSNTLLR